MGAPWHKRGVPVPRWAYRAWYVAQLVLSAFLALGALAPVALLLLGAITDALGFTLTAIGAAFTALACMLMGWLAIHRLRNPVTTAP